MAMRTGSADASSASYPQTLMAVKTVNSASLVSRVTGLWAKTGLELRTPKSSSKNNRLYARKADLREPLQQRRSKVWLSSKFKRFAGTGQTGGGVVYSDGKMLPPPV